MPEAEAPAEALAPGDVVWVQPEIAVGREQAGRRPALVVAGAGYPQTVDSFALVVPITTVDRDWPNHMEVFETELEHRSPAYAPGWLTFSTSSQTTTLARRSSKPSRSDRRRWMPLDSHGRWFCGGWAIDKEG
jgi:mRNA-degrading endonuclease toxin of MazEF toxin-antitoxin module